jgi:F0F1-type ATP synthase delta subunit
MKYPALIYAKALAAIAIDPKANSGEVTKNFMALLRKNGDESHARKIVEETARIFRRTSGLRKVTIESARPLSKKQKNALAGILKKDDDVEERVNPDLIAGIRIIMNDEMQFDGSMKKKLDAIFGN